MRELLFLGSTVADVILPVPHLPQTGEDMNLTGQEAALGGCCWNAFSAARLLGAAGTLFSPVGSGVWGEWVRRALDARGVQSIIPPVEAPNGCCYCLVEEGGERTFLCDRGAEYRFRPEWLPLLGDQTFDGAYLCGLEVEEDTGDVLLDYLEAHPPRRLYFAPGPRLCHIRPDRMARIFALHPVLHLNAAEALAFTRREDLTAAAALIRSLTQQDVIVTLGEDGAYILTAEGEAVIPSTTVQVVDTIGAGDAHAGAVMAGEALGLPLDRAVWQANRVSAAVVGKRGAGLTAGEWEAFLALHPQQV